MSENYIVINGKKAELTEEQLEQLGIKSNKKNNCEEMFDGSRASGYYIGNYCKDEAVVKQRALHETLNRLLWRASVEAGELANPWDGHHLHISISCESPYHILSTFGNHTIGCIYFPTVESAEKARENIVKPFMAEHPEFKW